MLIAVAVALVCSAMVSTAVYVLRPLQAAYAQVERNAAILRAAGALPEAAGEREIVSAFLKVQVRVLDLETGGVAVHMDGLGYDHWSAGAEILDTLPADARDVGLAQVPRYVPVYVSADGDRIVLPVHGRGMWSTIYGFLALERDLSTIVAMQIYRHGETPGIGDRIQRPEWLASWAGKRLYGADGRAQLVISSDPSISAERRVDAISGATVTSEALGRLVGFWASVYGPLLPQLLSR